VFGYDLIRPRSRLRQRSVPSRHLRSAQRFEVGLTLAERDCLGRSCRRPDR
jgi:hypothetical protein